MKKIFKIMLYPFLAIRSFHRIVKTYAKLNENKIVDSYNSLSLMSDKLAEITSIISSNTTDIAKIKSDIKLLIEK